MQPAVAGMTTGCGSGALSALAGMTTGTQAHGQFLGPQAHGEIGPQAHGRATVVASHATGVASHVVHVVIEIHGARLRRGEKGEER